MTKKLRIEEMCNRGYVDVTANLPLEEIGDEIIGEMQIRNPSQIVVIYDRKNDRATVYIPREDFGKERS